MITTFPNYPFSNVVLGASLGDLPSYLIKSSGQMVIITDENVNRLYGSHFPDHPVIEIGTGEAIKTQKTVDLIINKLLDYGADRHTFLVGIGGGIVCDITGFVASIFMRGLHFGYVSTTLLSQVDASIGGKTGINFGGYKNLVGCFNQPKFVLCATEMLSTLPEEEVKNGLVEIIKHALISDPEMFAFIEVNWESILNLEPDAIHYLVKRSIEIKAEVVLLDEREQGLRKTLNLGHTYGHAVESLLGISHGAAVAQGLVFAAFLSEKTGHCKADLILRIENLIRSIGLKTKATVSKKEVLEKMTKDKKRKSASVDYVFLKNIGSVEVSSLPFREMEQALEVYLS